MDNTETTQTGPTPENVTIAETFPAAPAPAPVPNDKGELKVVKKVAKVLQTAIDWAEHQAEAKFHVVVERTWGPVETIECATEEALRECVAKLCAEVYERRGKRENIDVCIHVFHGVRFHLQKWPFAALVHGKDVIPLNPLDDLSPVIDTSGSLYDPPALVNRASQPPTRRPSPSESSADSGPVEVLPVGQSLYGEDESIEDEEALPPGQDPQIVD